MSQERLGEAIGLTFQQVQKYERGSNRISAGTLYRLSQVLEVPVSFFFDLYDTPARSTTLASNGGDSDAAASGWISRRDARLLRLWRAAPQPIADEILALLSALSPDLRVGQEESGEDGTPVTVGSPHAAIPAAPAREASPKPRERSSAATSKARRRHGAVWDPADIYRAAKDDSSPRR